MANKERKHISNVEIVCDDGMTRGVKVFVGGVQLRGITSVTIDEMLYDDTVNVTFKVVGVRFGRATDDEQ